MISAPAAIVFSVLGNTWRLLAEKKPVFQTELMLDSGRRDSYTCQAQSDDSRALCAEQITEYNLDHRKIQHDGLQKHPRRQ
jgi:hypothetical protein